MHFSLVSVYVMGTGHGSNFGVPGRPHADTRAAGSFLPHSQTPTAKAGVQHYSENREALHLLPNYTKCDGGASCRWLL